ncbi:Alpha/beta hydrolase fold-1 [Apiospora phragmitis]|uniref:Alpha/beta hydrolase fold-1 n=1 Tax=Apiospora phragmitis TaxID=2905665 RepID=A0ABR1VR60_9PEZI
MLVYGACHPPHFYRNLIDNLHGHGYTVFAPALPTTGLDESVGRKTYLHNVKRIYEDLLPLLDAGKKAVLICHSFGGIAGSAATKNHTIKERKSRGQQGGIMAVVFIAAAILAQKDTCFLASVGTRLPTLYAVDLLYQSHVSIVEEVHFVAADIKVLTYYVKCTKDKAIPAGIQQEMAQNSGCHIIEIESDHSLFLHTDTT